MLLAAIVGIWSWVTISPVFDEVYKYEYEIDWVSVYRNVMLITGFLGACKYLLDDAIIINSIKPE